MNDKKITIQLTELEALKLIKAMAIARPLDDFNADTYFDIAKRACYNIAFNHNYTTAANRIMDKVRRRGWALGYDADGALAEQAINKLFDAA